MSALYRQARPSTFDEMVGQEHVKEVLLNALRSGRLAQAYLFSGPRGVGKTTSARLIAQAVNCTGPDPKPCGVCEGCRLVREGRHPDVLEIDAASNNSVEDVRELREKILLAPLLGRRKVVILDEAHMMSKSAFNALLKTLEEPPEHVIFIFATTEPERMPPTILSRTQHFRFRRLSEGEIAEKLARIVRGLGREAEPAALRLVARMADGAMRDGESLLDRLLTLEGVITLSQTEAALGLPPQAALFAVAEALDAGRIREALERTQGLYTQGFAARTLAQGLMEALRAGLYARLGLGTGPQLSAPEERLVAAMTALDQAHERLAKRSDALALELALLAAYQALHAVAPTPAEVRPPASAVPDFSPAPRARSTPPPAADAASGSPAPQPDLNQAWRDVLGQIGVNLRAFFREARPYPPEDGSRRLTLVFPERAGFHYQRAQKNLEAIQKAVRDVMGDYEVELVLGGDKKKVTPSSPAPPQHLSSAPVADRVAEALPQPPDPRPAEAPQPQPVPAPAPEPPSVNALFEDLGEPAYESPPLEEEAPSLARTSGSDLTADPRFQRLLQLFGARIRKIHRETPKESLAAGAEGGGEAEEAGEE
ncbi:DNA polymerase III subunit gamma/tau [Calidithermus timidus]|uniref:DNA polymerase III subunit gamma/tau n=1 Tax=Calidithermus timidus TaxID=307124 RepID=UPI00036E681C|nr:DNA polymerase III subunit gamma/tau [Calidithermus timidus]